jgi:hypothetical protein
MTMIQKWTMPLLIVSVSLLASDGISAQEKGQTGMTMGYPASVGLVWQPSERLAVRPELSLSTTSIETSFTGTGRTSSVGVGLSGLFYVGKWDSLSAYVSPRFAYNLTSSDPIGTLAIATAANNYSLIGSFGTQYALHRRFSVFGEVGVGYSHQALRSTGAISNSTITSHSWNTRTGIGVLFYF